MTETRRKALRRARGIVKRVENKIGYSLGLDLSGMSTRKLQFIDRKTLLREAAKNIEKKESKALSIEEAKNIRFKNTGHHIERTNVLKRSGSKEKIDMLKRIIDYGRTYSGSHNPGSKNKLGNIIEIQTRSKQIWDILENAERRLGQDELVNRIERSYGSVNRFGEIIEKLILIIYDKEHWMDGGENAYNVEIMEIVSAIG